MEEVPVTLALAPAGHLADEDHLPTREARLGKFHTEVLALPHGGWGPTLRVLFVAIN